MANVVDFKLTGLDEALNMLRQLPPEVVSKRGGPVKSGLRKGALVLRNAERRHLERVLSNQPQYSTDFLEKHLVVKRGKPPTGSNGERYIVTVKRKIYLGRSGKSRGGKATTTLASAQLLEYGSEKQPAEPWIRPAFNEAKQTAVATIERETLAAIDRVVRKLLRKG